MTVQEFLQNYGGNECVSIEGYCEEKHYDYFREADEWELSADNPNHYKPTCIAEEPWWNEVKISIHAPTRGATPEHPSWHTSSEKDSPTPQTLDPTIQRNKKHKAPRAATRLPFFI